MKLEDFLKLLKLRFYAILKERESLKIKGALDIMKFHD